MNPNVILCPIEFSASGTSALVQAVELARWYDADLHVAHVRGGRARRPTTSEPLNTDGVDRRLSSFMEAVDTEGLRLSTVALAGDPVTAVTEHAKSIAADLVVVARHGRRSGAYWRPGVYAKDLARTLPCPTLVVTDAQPRNAEGSFVNILCPTDFSAESAAALRQALILAQQSGGRLTLLHVLEGFPYGAVYSGGAAFRLIGEYRARVDRISRQMRSEVPSDAFNWCHIDTRVVSGVAHRTIVATASELNADLIVMGLPERSGIDRVIMASTATPVLRSAVCSVLLVRASAGDVSRVMAGEIIDPEAAYFATEHMSVEPSTARASRRENAGRTPYVRPLRGVMCVLGRTMQQARRPGPRALIAPPERNTGRTRPPPARSVLTKRLHGMRPPGANGELNWPVHLIASTAIARVCEIMNLGRSHFASPSHSGHRCCK